MSFNTVFGSEPFVGFVYYLKDMVVYRKPAVRLLKNLYMVKGSQIYRRRPF